MLTLSYEAGYLEMGLSQERSKGGGALSGDNDDDNNDVDNGNNINDDYDNNNDDVYNNNNDDNNNTVISGGQQKNEAHIPPLLGVAPLGIVPLSKEHQFQYRCVIMRRKNMRFCKKMIDIIF